MADQSVRRVETGTLPAEPLAAVEPRPLDRILAAWREAQLRFEMAKPGSPEAHGAADEIERLREEYHATAETKMTAR
jgi:hypothetical protein